MFKLSPTIKRILAALFITTLVASCADTRSINQSSAQQYRQAISAEKSKGTLDTSSMTAQRVHRIFNKMVPYARQYNKTGVPFDWEISVIKSNEINAWAMPGGKMVFYTGLVNKLNLTDDEIAVVMGHEMAHALLEHGKSQANRQTAVSIAATIAMGALASQGVSVGASQDLVGSVADLGIMKPFSRSAESEADEVGLMLSAQSGFNPQAAPNLWDKMQKMSGGGSIPAIFSTHPSDQARKENLERLMPKAMELYNAAKNKRS
ncbi:deoxyribonuclease HsdR [Gallibacterium salpingitidis]|uniref:Deoxyribonuclease HsdR n=1 Tax=Gallibacterium salpingitidis TaxID=505341 RepID=A0AB36E0X1_9PAST|nr:M48 family metallopeptidase [Gallibacterium salpingitidis]OBX06511.1 deoxyribonuclease HsdR [Gallibacterium salpingitidis]OBX08862.1 deoxyribonuclease HsdR [Gallibacterium salpingitidis]WKS99456.1 M48 family metallopeptidase [Gallibacterium salpingitidis]